MKRVVQTLLILIVILLIPLKVNATQDYEISWRIVDSGGGNISGGNNLLHSVIVQPVITDSKSCNIKHIGPMGDEFNDLLPGLGGEGENYINTLDADGIPPASIPGLYKILQGKPTLIVILERGLSTGAYLPHSLVKVGSNNCHKNHQHDLFGLCDPATLVFSR